MVDKGKIENPMFRYWLGILEIQTNILRLVRSFRESNLILMISSLEKLVEIFFALDHTKYSRWLSVFIQDLKLLSVKNPQLFSYLSKNMSACTSSADFSSMAFDQRHEQLNKEIKATGGYINAVNREDHEFLRTV